MTLTSSDHCLFVCLFVCFISPKRRLLGALDDHSQEVQKEVLEVLYAAVIYTKQELDLCQDQVTIATAIK